MGNSASSQWKCGIHGGYYQWGDECPQCEDRERRNRQERQRAYEAAESRRRAEEKRVRDRAAELEREKKKEMERRERERKLAREAEMKRIQDQRKQEASAREQKRIEQERLLKSNSPEQIMKNVRNFKKTGSPFLQYQQLYADQTVQEIYNGVNTFACIGEAVSKRVTEISNDLQATLKDDYTLIEPEMKRYKKYGNEMKSMTKVFVDEFSAVFVDKAETLDGLNDAQIDDDEKELYQQVVLKQMGKLTTAIKNVEAKLFLMHQYYDQMKEDYKYFEQFCKLKGDQVQSVTFTLQKLAEQIRRDGDKGVLEGTGDGQTLEFTEKYNVTYQGSYEQGLSMKKGILSGAAVGAVAGGAIGYAAGGPIGAIGGLIVGGIIGAGIGALCAKINPHETVITNYTEEKEVSVKSEKIVYSSKDHAAAIENILSSIQDNDTFKKMKKELEENEDTAWKQKQECENMINLINKIKGKIVNYKTQMSALKAQIKDGVDETEAMLIKSKLKKLTNGIKDMIEQMKSV
eukprot:CAMPEP_0201576070 /NCGR_PEP_ID=MMETSP0190_2-20130828/21660_1 /ASSEMBLY_ACC=CAM_ASM_000263 /TAXON_ID=37353 /ORGANISM="Rosalina sp." /LENGTH=516 /DNA_ID=CAMNT_0048006487 /DNA_START=61 /DNA_END=1611 /DNA_ORIENTATION=+